MDKEQLLAWLDAQIRTHGEETGRAMAVWVAHRAAARVLPFAWDEFTFSEWPRQFAVTALPILLLHIMSRIDRQKATFQQVSPMLEALFYRPQTQLRMQEQMELRYWPHALRLLWANFRYLASPIS